MNRSLLGRQMGEAFSTLGKLCVQKPKGRRKPDMLRG